MGLAAPKQRIKLSHDPNNTRWTSNTSSFGHKIMSSQGWKPGEYLGAKDAPHAEFHTAANASHIRVAIKDDNLGIGAKIGSGVGHGECTGLDAFKDLLGRLNGKDEDEIEKEQKSREDLKRAIYTEQRWGSIRFVKGGFLIGDKIQHLIEGEAERLRKLAAGETTSSESNSSDASDLDEAPQPVVEKKKSKKRKLEEVDHDAELDTVKVKKSKKSKRKSENAPEDPTETEASVGDSKISNKKSKRKQEAKAEEHNEDDESEIKRRKKEKKEKKHKKDKKEKKERSKIILEDDLAKEMRKNTKREKKKREAESDETSRSSTKASTPATPADGASGRSTPMMQGRHAVRARNIAQKRLASMDVASLNQIFMIKS